ncbi:MAG: hypothetical protein Q8K45_11235 [Rubrivivax sp.]|nr:hypothetical protein [Rubrivivax sp.]
MSADRVPTLTEVVELDLPVPADESEPCDLAREGAATLTPEAALPTAPGIDVEEVVAQVLGEMLPRIDMLLESRLREALAPALARAADGLIRDTRNTLSVAVRDLVQEAVDRALQRRNDV